ncbi:hypothetical protein RJ640_002415, partial [Escallonia rubra]
WRDEEDGRGSGGGKAREDGRGSGGGKAREDDGVGNDSMEVGMMGAGVVVANEVILVVDDLVAADDCGGFDGGIIRWQNGIGKKETQTDHRTQRRVIFMDADQILVEESSYVRAIILNRPKQLNALSSQMISRLLELFLAFENDCKVKLIIMKGKGRAFCAGGDVAAVVRDISGGRPFSFTVIVPCYDIGNWKLGAEYFWNEFTLNYLMATYSKTQVSILNGIVMGGGAGASIHGRFRVATENSVFAMPETALGLFPDVVSSSQVLEKADLSSFIPLQSFQEELTPIFQEKPRLCAQTPTNNNIRLLLTSTQVLLQNDPKTPQNPHLIFQHQHCPFQHVNGHKICNYLHIGDGRYVQTMRELDFIGEYVGLTGARLDGAEMLACGLATHFVPSERLTSLEEALHKVDSGDSMVVSAIIEEFSLLPTLKEKSAYHR